MGKAKKRKPDKESVPVNRKEITENKSAVNKVESKPGKTIKYREFPGPAQVQVLFRVAFEKEAYADFILHARSFLDNEICGVLVGNTCEDDEGIYTHIQAIIRGNAARQGSTHVTFTQETWNQIHETLETGHPGCQIMGWYHSHPGFGVEFSDMDNFIQKNFFPLPTQVGLLTDPLKGDVALCINREKAGTEQPAGADADNAIVYLDKFWVAGRMLNCYTPTGNAAGAGAAPDALQQFGNFETRFNQFLDKADREKRDFHTFTMFAGMILLAAVLLFAGFNVYRYFAGNEKTVPGKNSLLPEPVKITIGTQTLVFNEQPFTIPVTTMIDDKIIYLDITLRGWVFRQSPNKQ